MASIINSASYSTIASITLTPPQEGEKDRITKIATEKLETTLILPPPFKFPIKINEEKETHILPTVRYEKSKTPLYPKEGPISKDKLEGLFFLVFGVEEGKDCDIEKLFPNEKTRFEQVMTGVETLLMTQDRALEPLSLIFRYLNISKKEEKATFLLRLKQLCLKTDQIEDFYASVFTFSINDMDLLLYLAEHHTDFVADKGLFLHIPSSFRLEVLLKIINSHFNIGIQLLHEISLEDPKERYLLFLRVCKKNPRIALRHIEHFHLHFTSYLKNALDTLSKTRTLIPFINEHFSSFRALSWEEKMEYVKLAIKIDPSSSLYYFRNFDLKPADKKETGQLVDIAIYFESIIPKLFLKHLSNIFPEPFTSASTPYKKLLKVYKDRFNKEPWITTNDFVALPFLVSDSRKLLEEKADELAFECEANIEYKPRLFLTILLILYSFSTPINEDLTYLFFEIVKDKEMISFFHLLIKDKLKTHLTPHGILQALSIVYLYRTQVKTTSLEKNREFRAFCFKLHNKLIEFDGVDSAIFCAIKEWSLYDLSIETNIAIIKSLIESKTYKDLNHRLHIIEAQFSLDPTPLQSEALDTYSPLITFASSIRKDLSLKEDELPIENFLSCFFLMRHTSAFARFYQQVKFLRHETPQPSYHHHIHHLKQLILLLTNCENFTTAQEKFREYRYNIETNIHL